MLIVSVQKFNNKTQKIVNEIEAVKGLFAIRTDTPIKTKLKVIGLKKNNLKYYITTKIKDINSVSKWSDYIAIDCRLQNPKLQSLLEYCQYKKFKIVADIATEKDIDNLSEYKEIVSYVATTFNFDKTDREKCRIIKHAKKNFTVIAEGGYDSQKNIDLAINAGATHICIGTAIFDYLKKVKEFAGFCLQ